MTRPGPRRLEASPKQRRSRAGPELAKIVQWYFREVYARDEGPGVVPFYCDPERVGHFAVDQTELRAGSDAALFRLFVALAMFQARRDVVIMRQQRSFTKRAAASLVSLPTIARRAQANPCRQLRSLEVFDSGCSVRRLGTLVTCGERPDATCHVKEAAVSFNRMADLGKLPTSAWLRVWREGGLRKLLAEVDVAESAPRARAELLVSRFSRVRRVGRKLATMFVSALSTPSLAPGLTPWYPEVDGNELVVVDTNVLRGVRVLGRGSQVTGYESSVRWVRKEARAFDLREFRQGLPRYSPRLIQQAIYSFCSRSNRLARPDTCRLSDRPCADCVPRLCPLPAHVPR